MSLTDSFTEIAAADFVGQCASRINPDWMLITAGAQGQPPATMTVSFGAFGFLWGRHLALAAIRHSRNTLPYIMDGKAFSLAFFEPSFREKLHWCGRHSGKDFDKATHCDFHTLYEDGVPYFAESSAVLICHLMYREDIVRQNFVNPAIYDEWYGHGVHKDDMHAMLYASIDKVLEKI